MKQAKVWVAWIGLVATTGGLQAIGPAAQATTPPDTHRAVLTR